MKVGFITLGCDKNTVDTERYLARLQDCGAEHTDELQHADVIIVNTCGFIDAAKQESIEAIVEAGRHKVDGACRALIAVGCMVERHKGELAEELPEVDVFLGASEMDRLVPELEKRGLVDDAVAEHPGVRVYTGELPHVRYLKISEGCDHGCAFCAIPLMRGRHRSFAVDDVVREAQLLELQGAREINLVAQDLAHWGRDLRNGTGLPDLLATLVRETTVPWFRMLYLYSFGITAPLLELMAREPRILPYLDMPIQHVADRVLERMRRPERKATIRDRVARMRAVVPDVAIRTTCIVGFPGETEAEFIELLEFLEEIRFERVGAFTYSAQEGTRAAALDDDVPEAVKLDRLDRLTSLQRAISGERYERHIGRTVQAIVDRAADPIEGVPAQARTIWQADDVDGVTWLDAALPPGTLVEARLDAVVDDVDFEASVARVLRAAPTMPSSRAVRALPMATLTIGSYGR